MFGIMAQRIPVFECVTYGITQSTLMSQSCVAALAQAAEARGHEWAMWRVISCTDYTIFIVFISKFRAQKLQ